jgi:hypothetical protein
MAFLLVVLSIFGPVAACIWFAKVSEQRNEVFSEKAKTMLDQQIEATLSHSAQ